MKSKKHIVLAIFILVFFDSCTKLSIHPSKETNESSQHNNTLIFKNINDIDFRGEANRLTNRTLRTFWHPEAHLFKGPIDSAETVNSSAPNDSGYVFWPTVLTFLFLTDAEKQMPGSYKNLIYTTFESMEKYFDSDNHNAYNAWLMFPGNNDKYYDDNALASYALVQAYEVTSDKIFLQKAWDIMWKFIYLGWNKGFNTGGMPWGTKENVSPYTDLAACSTTFAAMAALALAKNADSFDAVEIGGLHKDKGLLLGWAKKSLQFVQQRLVDPTDNLVQNSLYLNSNQWQIQNEKWTYNSGNYLKALMLLYKLSCESGNCDSWALDSASKVAEAAIDHGSMLYDQSVANPNQRYWLDTGYFINHLVDGLVEYYRFTYDQPIKQEILRQAAFGYNYLNDNTSGFYYRNWRLFLINQTTLQIWETLTGQLGVLYPDASERAQLNSTSTPVINRPIVPTLMGNAGMARIFWLTSLVQNL